MAEAAKQSEEQESQLNGCWLFMANRRKKPTLSRIIGARSEGKLLLQDCKIKKDGTLLMSGETNIVKADDIDPAYLCKNLDMVSFIHHALCGKALSYDNENEQS